MIKVLDLFSGIGGFALAVQNVFGKDNVEFVGFCEIEKYAQKVLAKNFPQVPIFDDITTLQTDKFKDIDLITGGFPCQDISVAGKGKGIVKNETRSGLWFELLRIIRDIRPKFALVENVPALTYRGGTIVLGTLAEAGFDAEWQIISAAEMGAWHKRERIWIVAYPQISNRRRVQLRTYGVCGEQQNEKTVGNASSTRSKRSSKSAKTVSDSAINRRISRTGNWQERQTDSEREWSNSESQQERKRLWSDPEQKNRNGEVSDTGSEHINRIGNSQGSNFKTGMGSKKNETGLHDRTSSRSSSGGKERNKTTDVTNTDSHNVEGNESKLRVPKRRNKQKKKQVGYTDRNRKEGNETETRDVTNTDSQRTSCGFAGKKNAEDVRKPSQCTEQRETGEIESGLGRGFDGISSWLDGSWELGIDRTTLISKNTANRLKGLGNAIVPQCAMVILERIKPLIIQGE